MLVNAHNIERQGVFFFTLLREEVQELFYSHLQTVNYDEIRLLPKEQD